MGWDLHWITPTDDERTAYAAYNAADARTDREGYMAALGAWMTARDGAHWASSLGYGGALFDTLATLGVVCHTTAPTTAEWDAASEGVDWDECDELGRTVNTDSLRRLLTDHRGETPGIPSHKFSSNDGWLITPVEIESGLDVLRATTSPTAIATAARLHNVDVADVLGLLAYFTRAAEHGNGVRVS